MNYFWDLFGIGLLVFLSATGVALIIWAIPHRDLPAFEDEWMYDDKPIMLKEANKKKVKK